MATKNYGLTIDINLMEAFKKKCRDEDVKYSSKVSELIRANIENTEPSGKAEELLLKVVDTLDQVKELMTPVNTGNDEGDDF